jgi:hypothetical protein
MHGTVQDTQFIFQQPQVSQTNKKYFVKLFKSCKVLYAIHYCYGMLK